MLKMADSKQVLQVCCHGMTTHDACFKQRYELQQVPRLYAAVHFF